MKYGAVGAAAWVVMLFTAAGAWAQDEPRRGMLEFTVQIRGTGSSDVGTGQVNRTVTGSIELVGIPSAADPLAEDGAAAAGVPTDLMSQAVAACGGNRQCEDAIRQQLRAAGMPDRVMMPATPGRYIAWTAEGCAEAEITITDAAEARYGDEGGGPARHHAFRAQGSRRVDGTDPLACVSATFVHDQTDGKYALQIRPAVEVEVVEEARRDGQVVSTDRKRAATVLSGENRTVGNDLVVRGVPVSGTASIPDVITRTFDAQRIRGMPLEAVITWKFTEAQR
jgi:hypothetical protein